MEIVKFNNEEEIIQLMIFGCLNIIYIFFMV